MSSTMPYGPWRVRGGLKWQRIWIKTRSQSEFGTRDPASLLGMFPKFSIPSLRRRNKEKGQALDSPSRTGSSLSTGGRSGLRLSSRAARPLRSCFPWRQRRSYWDVERDRLELIRQGDPVPSRPLRPVHRRIGFQYQFLLCLCMVRKAGDSNAGGQLCLETCLSQKDMRMDGCREAFGDHSGGLHRALRKNHGKFITAIPDRNVHIPHALSHDLRQLSQTAASQGMPMQRVDLLKVIEVQKDQGKRRTIPVAAPDLPFQGLIQVPGVE